MAKNNIITVRIIMQGGLIQDNIILGCDKDRVQVDVVDLDAFSDNSYEEMFRYYEGLSPECKVIADRAYPAHIQQMKSYMKTRSLSCKAVHPAVKQGGKRVQCQSIGPGEWSLA